MTTANGYQFGAELETALSHLEHTAGELAGYVFDGGRRAYRVELVLELPAGEHSPADWPWRDVFDGDLVAVLAATLTDYEELEEEVMG